MFSVFLKPVQFSRRQFHTAFVWFSKFPVIKLNECVNGEVLKPKVYYEKL